ncbi:alpha-L-rhamnosidase [Motilibacter peucedani]|uniref:alpha-L-rhamnosidase n=1 Tax=Motilibacter peucedani TaxID=598650 RepID=A0A420XQ95_9ACTN|nr:glycoside hydrolase family 78 protein [Motilibacter peucedani]RKS75471.1 alpha-L-rhamnosidase [Motilibacter peucedani]
MSLDQPGEGAPTTQVRAVTVEHHAHPLGIGEPTPRLSWLVETSEPGWRQEAYEVEGRTVDGTLLWSSGRVECDESVLRPWPGPALASRERAAVRVRVWGRTTQVTAWSDETTLEVGLLSPQDWSAAFVSPADGEHVTVDGPADLLRREFTVGEELLRARLYASACGVYELELNGSKVGADVLAPGWTSYGHRLKYQTYDVTTQLRRGPNAIGAFLADGWFRGSIGWNRVGKRYGTRRALLVQLELDYANGRREVVVTDERWTSRQGPITRASLYDGERYDATGEVAGWSAAGAALEGWTPVVRVDVATGALVAPYAPPVRATELRAPTSVTKLVDGTHLVDFGQNLVGRLQIRLRGPRGTVVGLRHAEVLEEGRISTRPLRTAKSHDEYVAAGHDEETWEPRFTVHGFRYAEITGWPGEIGAGDVVAVVCHDDMTRSGWFASSNPLLDRLHENVVWSMRGNFLTVPTDCPQRDERLGWTGDLQVFAPTASFLYDSAASITDWLRDVCAETGSDGLVPLYVPHVETSFPQFHCAVWGDVTTVVPLLLHERTGDQAAVEAGYDTARAWVEGCRGLLDDRDVISSGPQLGDWLDPSAPADSPQEARTDPYLVATAYLARSARLLSRQAALVGKQDDVGDYSALADRVTAGFRREFVTPSGRCASDTQTAYALALQFDLLETEEQRRHARRRLAELAQASDFRIGTGFAGTPLVLDALTGDGDAETAYRVLLETGCPSWLYAVTMGATTVWERWDSMLPDGSVNPGAMTSFNHYAFGSVADWMHRTLAGLAPAEPGYRTIRVAPRPGGGLTAASARHLTPYGPASTSWTRTGETLTVDVVVPPNAAAVVELPGTAAVTVESGHHTFRTAFRAAEQDPIAPLPPRQRF